MFKCIVSTCLVVGVFSNTTLAQKEPQITRLARLVIDSTQLSNYKQYLKEEIEASMKLEKGVKTLYAVFDNAKPNHVSILEIYASRAAYLSHLQTPHFKKYKEATKSMVQHLELTETTPLIPNMYIKKP
jgi:quinol monooxygenase YgiN